MALHNAYDVGGIQPYVGCIELSISGSGSANPAGVSFPGEYSQTSKGMVINIYQPYASYEIPGPALYIPSNTSSATPIPTTPPTNTPNPTPKPTTPTPTSAPTTKPTTTPTTQPPTTTPTTAPTWAPTTQAPTQAPTRAPTQPATGGQDSVKVRLHQGSNAWWMALEVSAGGQTVVRVEIQDNAPAAPWRRLSDQQYAYLATILASLLAPLLACLLASLLVGLP